VLCAAVVVYCHTSTSVTARFLFRAQDHNMTNGDFAWFTFRPWRTWRSDRPWDWYSSYIEDPNELPRRRRAFHVVKQVLLASYNVLTLFWIGCYMNVVYTTTVHIRDHGVESGVAKYLSILSRNSVVIHTTCITIRVC